MTTRNQFSLKVRVHGHEIREFTQNGETFVEGRDGSEYDLCIENMSNRRACVVLSVDGLSVMNGQTATQHDSGYIVEPHSTEVIPGWRLNDASVAGFRFGTIDKAYALQMGKPSNIGVIGAAVFFEKFQMPEFVLYSVFDRSTEAPQTFRGISKSIGTEFGDQKEHAVKRVQFDREPTPVAELTVRYATAADLAKIGIDVNAKVDAPSFVTAQPFTGGCPPPKTWQPGSHRRETRGTGGHR